MKIYMILFILTIIFHFTFKEFWNEAPLERQLSILYVLNAYFKDAHKNRIDLTDWVDTVAKV